MYDQFTDRARKVMQLANQEAQRFNHQYIGTEHILLGLVKEGGGIGAEVLESFGIDMRKIRLEVEKLVQSGPDPVQLGKLPLTPRAKQVVEFAIDESKKKDCRYVGTEHVLLGLLLVSEGVASMVLTGLSVDVDNSRSAIDLLMKGVTSKRLVRLERHAWKVFPVDYRTFYQPMAVCEPVIITVDELRVVCDTTVRLVELRQRNCSNLCVENIAPDILHKLLTRLQMAKLGMACNDSLDVETCK